jgi:hypothetical protein
MGGKRKELNPADGLLLGCFALLRHAPSPAAIFCPAGENLDAPTSQFYALYMLKRGFIRGFVVGHVSTQRRFKSTLKGNTMATANFKFAAIQLAVTSDKSKTLDHAREKIREAAKNGAQVISLPVRPAILFFRFNGIKGQNAYLKNICYLGPCLNRFLEASILYLPFFSLLIGMFQLPVWNKVFSCIL